MFHLINNSQNTSFVSMRCVLRFSEGIVRLTELSEIERPVYSTMLPRFLHVIPNLSTASHILADTAALNESLYTKRDVEEAK